MSLAALLLLFLAIAIVGLLTSALLALVERSVAHWPPAPLGSRRYSAELPTWGKLYRDAMARKCTRPRRLSSGPERPAPSRLVNASESVYHRPIPRHGG